jgi:hypothetical protein
MSEEEREGNYWRALPYAKEKRLHFGRAESRNPILVRVPIRKNSQGSGAYRGHRLGCIVGSIHKLGGDKNQANSFTNFCDTSPNTQHKHSSVHWAGRPVLVHGTGLIEG